MKKVFVVVVLILLLAVCAAGFFAWNLVYRNNINLPQGKSAILFIPTGADFGRVTDSLYRKRLVRNLWAFEVLSRFKKYPEKVHPGRYRIRAGLSNTELVNLLRAGLQEPVRFTFNNIRTKA